MSKNIRNPIETTGAAGPQADLLRNPTTRSPRGPAYTPAPGQLVPWSYQQAIQNHGLEVHDYFNYVVPWGGGITTRDWFDAYSTSTVDRQKEMVDRWLIALTEYYDLTSNVIAATAQLFSRNGQLMALYGGVDAFKSRYPVVTTAIDYSAKRRQEAENAVRTVRQLEPEVVGKLLAPYSHAALVSHSGSTTMQFLLKRFPFKALVPYLNQAYIHRRNMPRSAQDSHVNTTDWIATKGILQSAGPSLRNFLCGSTLPLAQDMKKKAVELGLSAQDVQDMKATRRSPPNGEMDAFWTQALEWYGATLHQGKTIIAPINGEWLRKNDLVLDGEYGLIVPFSQLLGHAPPRELTSKVVSSIEYAARGAPASSLETGGQTVEFNEERQHRRTPARRESADFVAMGRGARTRAIADVERNTPRSGQVGVRSMTSSASERTPQEEALRIAGNIIARRTRLTSSLLQTRAGPPTNYPRPRPLARETPVPEGQTMRSDERRRLELEDEDPEYEEDVAEDVDPQARHTARTGRNCNCTDRKSILVEMLRNTKANRKLSDSARVRLIDQWYRECYHYAPGGRRCRPDSLRVCYHHLQFLCSKMGLITRAANAKTLRETLLYLYRTKPRWGAIQTDPLTATLFTKPFRGDRTADDLLSYRYRPAPVHVQVNWDRVAAVLGYTDRIRTFHKTGTLVTDCFTWVFRDPELVKILDRCYDMYDYHTRLIDGKSNLGWCRTMFHSVIQQLMRGDVQYWLLYAMIRKEPYLVSYPYYTKYTRPGDNTYFRHIDLNIADAARDEHGIRAIQGSVSWNNENDANCTEMLDGFHHILREYQDWREKSNIKDSTGYIEKWDDKVDWPKAIADQHPQVQWKKHPCPQGWVRISDPRLPHGSTGPATIKRRTMLPWFVQVHHDMTTMEMPDMGSYQEIATAFQQCTAAPKTPSGHSNRYGGIKWAFPGDQPPVFTSAISRAVNCQIRWDSPAAQEALADLFYNPNQKKIWNYIQETRKATAKMVKEHWRMCVDMEKRAYGLDKDNDVPNRSFFTNQGAHPARVRNWWDHDGQVEPRTALDQLRDHYAAEPDVRYQSQSPSLGSF
jgi:hypothetical protein